MKPVRAHSVRTAPISHGEVPEYSSFCGREPLACRAGAHPRPGERQGPSPPALGAPADIYNVAEDEPMRPSRLGKRDRQDRRRGATCSSGGHGRWSARAYRSLDAVPANLEQTFQRDDWLGSSVPQRAAGVEPAHDCPTGATMMEHDTRLRVALRFLILAGVGVGMWALR